MFQPNGARRRLLVAGGLLSLMAGIGHIVMIPFGGRALRYFGAGEELARMADEGSIVPAIVTGGVAAVLSIFGAYALSGAGVIRRLPLVGWVVAGITAVFLIRGAGVVFQIVADTGPVRDVVFSFIALGIGLLYLFGVGPITTLRSRLR